MTDRRILIVAKSPVAGQVKTRLCPPCTPQQAAELAEAALRDTLAAALACDATARVIALEGDPGSWLPPEFEVIPQQGSTFSQRLQHVWDTCHGMTLQIGMDTPQVNATMINDGFALLDKPHVDAVLGFADDGGWWALGLRHGQAGLFQDVAMSTPHTGTAQWERLIELGLSPHLLPTITDVDTFAQAHEVAEIAPHSHFAKVLRSLDMERCS